MQSGPRVSGMLVKGAVMGTESLGYELPVGSPSQQNSKAWTVVDVFMNFCLLKSQSSETVPDN